MTERLLLLIVLLFSSALHAAQTIVDTQRVEKEALITEQTRIDSQARRFSISSEDWKRYEVIMAGEGRYHWKDTDPVWVLAIYAQTAEQRQRFAKLAARQEYERTRKLMAFKDAYVEAFNRLYGDIPIMDVDKLKSRVARFQMNASVNSPAPTQRMEGNEHSLESLFDDALSTAGDRYVLFTNTDCPSCDELFKRLSFAQVQKPGVVLDVYFIGDKRESVVNWAQSMGVRPDDLSSGHITLNTDTAMYEQYGRPALPAAFYFDASREKVLAVRLENNP